MASLFENVDQAGFSKWSEVVVQVRAREPEQVRIFVVWLPHLRCAEKSP